MHEQICVSSDEGKESAAESFHMAMVPLVNIRLNPHQPRKIFEESELWSLVHSIESVGLIHPPLVRPLEELGFYELVSGERRYRASELAGLIAIPVHIKESSSKSSAEMALIENIQRVDLNPIEIAKALQQLIEEFHFSQQALSDKIGKKRSTVANYLRLLSLPVRVQSDILAGAITMGHAKAILSLEGEERQLLLHRLIMRDDLSVRAAEKGALKIGAKAKTKKLSYETRDFFLEQLSSRLQETLGTKAYIQSKGKGGRIFIDYYSYDDLDRLLKIFQCQE